MRTFSTSAMVAAALALAALAGCGSAATVHEFATDTPTAQYTGPSELPDGSSETVTAEPEPSEPAAVDLAQNEPLDIANDDASRGRAVINCVRVSSVPGSPSGDRPQNGAYVVINVTVDAVAGKLSVNPLYFQYQDSAGQTYGMLDGNGYLAGFDPTLDAHDVPAGRRVGGNVVFDAPAPSKARPGRVLYESVLGDIIGAWSITHASPCKRA